MEAADIAFVLPEIPEASPIGAPTTSTTMMMVWGDALAMALLERRGFSKQDFGRYHPGGKLGSQFLKVSALMHKGNDIPCVNESELMSIALVEMTSKGFGCTAVENNKGQLTGIITDGDLRRHVKNLDLMKMKSSAVMTKKPMTISPDMLAMEAMAIMSEKKITTLLVAEGTKLLGILHIHDLLRACIQ